MNFIILLFSALIFFNFLYLLAPTEPLQYTVGVLALLCWACSVGGAGRLFRITGILFAAGGLAFFLSQGYPLYQLPLYMTSNVTLLALFFSLPFINSVISVGQYGRYAGNLLKSRMRHGGQAYGRSTIVSFLLGGLLNIATVPFVAQLVKSLLQEEMEPKPLNALISKSVLRGFILSLLWSPMEIMVAMSIELTGIHYLEVLPWLLLVTAVMLILNWGIGQQYRTCSISALSGERAATDRNLIRKMGELVFFLCLFIVVVVSATSLFHIGFLAAVTLAMIPFSCFWAVCIGKGKRFYRYVLPVWKARTVSLKSYMILFLSSGFFAMSFYGTPAMEWVQRPFQLFSHQPLAFYLVIQAIFIAFAFLGFHTVVTLTILTQLIVPFTGFFHPAGLSVVLICTGLAATMISPFNISPALIGNVLGIHPFQVTRWNFGYAVLLGWAGIGCAFLIELLT